MKLKPEVDEIAWLQDLSKKAKKSPKMRIMMQQIFDGLSPTEQKVLRLRFGIGDERPMKETPSCFKVTRARVLRLEKEALARLAAAKRKKSLRS